MVKRRLVDAVARNLAHPKTFSIPSARELDALAVGDWVKIAVSFSQSSRVVDVADSAAVVAARAIWLAKVGPEYAASVSAERFWLRVISIEGDEITGTVANDLLHTAHHGLKEGDTVTCDRRNIIEITKE